MITFYMRCASVFTCEVTMELDFFIIRFNFLLHIEQWVAYLKKVFCS